MIAMRELNTNFVNNTPNMANSGPNQDGPMVASAPLTAQSSALTKRCVIIQKDEKGYGLRVSGDNPVFVESVRRDGAAWRAGVRSGDRIIKVNGTLVTKHGHGEVVRMIQNCGSYVGLTLLGLKTTPTQSTVTPTPLQITGPQPASESTQQAYEESRMATIREMIRREREHLDKMVVKKNQSEIDKTVKSIEQLESTLEKMTFDVTRHRHTSMSAENLTTNTSSEASIAAANARKSHSFGQYDTRAPIMTMESDDENDDFTNNNNNRNSNINSNNKSHLDISDIPSTVDAIHAHSLQMARWLISQQCPPHALLFYTMAGHVFPSLVSANNSRRCLQRWAWQIACTWLVPDSPLAFSEFPPETLSTFDAILVSPQSSLETLFEPFIEQTRDILSQQLDAWRSAAIIGLAPKTMSTPKEELHATIELLLNESTTNIELAIDNLISHAHVNNVSTIAVVTSLLTIGQYVFACPSKHLLLSHTDSSTSPPLNPVLKLSLDHSSSTSNKKHKRAISLPSRNISPGHIEAGHHFVQTQELTKLLYCSGCLLPIWGTFGHTCAHCQMSVHVWCMKNAAANSPCPGPQSDGHSTDSTPNARVKKNRRWNSDRYTILDILKKTVAHTHEPHAPPLISSTSSSDDEDDNVTIGAKATPPPTVNADTSTNSTTPTPPNTIPRSESFRQRRKTVPSYRKRSDPALTTSNSTLATTVSTDPTVTPDLSGSPTNTSLDNWISSSDDEDDQSQSDAQQQNTNSSPNMASVTQQNTIDEDTPPPLPPRPTSEKRKQIHNEIIESELRHVNVLNFIHNQFYKPLKVAEALSAEHLVLIFCNTKKLRKIHRNIYKMLRSPNKSIEQSLCDIFCGELGSQLETEASIFCANQKLGGLDTWRVRKKDSKVKNIVDIETRTKEMPEDPLVRLSLEDHLGTVFQRPLRYQLLLDRLTHATPSDSVEYQLIARALARSREIGSLVNEATRRAESKQRLEEIVRKTDKTQGLILDLKGHNLVHEGALTWRITKQKCVDVWLVLTDKILLILARDSNDRFILKLHTNPSAKNKDSAPKTPIAYGPIVQLNGLLTRAVATDPTAFFLISTEQDVFYEFATATPNECKQWKEAIANATITFNDGKSPQQHVIKLRDLTSQPSGEEDLRVKDDDEPDGDKDEKQELEEFENNVNDSINNNNNNNNNNNSNDEIPADEVSNEAISDNNKSPQIPETPKTSRVEGVIRYVRDEECHAPDLISPSNIKISSEPIISEALAVQSPQQQIAEIDSKVSKLLDEKRSILQRMHGITNQWEWALVCDFAQHDNNSTTGSEVSFFDKAMSMVSTLARDGLTTESYVPLVSLRDQIDALLARLSLEIETQTVDVQSAEQVQNIYFEASDQSSEETAVYF